MLLQPQASQRSAAPPNGPHLPPPPRTSTPSPPPTNRARARGRPPPLAPQAAPERHSRPLPSQNYPITLTAATLNLGPPVPPTPSPSPPLPKQRSSPDLPENTSSSPCSPDPGPLLHPKKVPPPLHHTAPVVDLEKRRQPIPPDEASSLTFPSNLIRKPFKTSPSHLQFTSSVSKPPP